MSEATSVLAYPVHFRVIGKYLGQLAVMQAILVLAPLGVSLYFGEYDFTLRYLVICLTLAALSYPLLRLAEPQSIQINEALTIVALAFVTAPLVAMYPMTAAGMAPLDALFEAISAVSTTGLSTLPTLADKPHTFLFARAWMQWYGGLGIVVLSVALLMGHHVSARRLTEATTDENLATTARTYARRVLWIYLGLTFLGLAGALLLDHDPFASLVHILSAVSTGGFSIYDNSLAGVPSWSERYWIIAVAFCGAIPLAFYYKLTRKSWRAVLLDVEVVGLFLICGLICVLLVMTLHYNSGFSWEDSWRHGGLMSLSAQSTTGFASLNLAELDHAAKTTLIVSMLIGGSVGSTAGGIKVLRILILLRLIQLTLRRTMMPPHAVVDYRFAGHGLESEDLVRILVLILLYAGVIFASWMVFLFFGYEPLDSLFEVVSATATVGLSVGITQESLPALLKLVLCIDMLLGRVEIVALLILIYPRNWIGRS